MIITGQGAIVDVVGPMQVAHIAMLNSRGEPTDGATEDTVIGIPTSVLGQLGTPPATLAATITAIRAAIAADLGARAR